MARASGRPHSNGAGPTPGGRRLPGRRAGRGHGADASGDTRSLQARARGGDRRDAAVDPLPQTGAPRGSADPDLWDAVRRDLREQGVDTGPVAALGSDEAHDRRTAGSPTGTRQRSLRRSRRAEPHARGRRRAAPRAGPNASGAPRPALERLRPSDATVARLGAALLWVLVILAAYGGVTAWLGSGSGAPADAGAPAPGEVPDGRWTAAGFAERYVTSYLAAGSEGGTLEPYLGYTPDLPPTAEPAAPGGPVRTVDVTTGHEDRADYWSVTVAVSPTGTAGTESGGTGSDTGTAPAAETFWQVGVDTSGAQPVAVGLPAPVASPTEPDRGDLAVPLRTPPTDEPMVASVEGFLAAYLCGAPDLDRYVHPDYPDAEALTPEDPPVCGEITVERWGAAPSRTGGGDPEEEARQTVVAEVELDAGSDARRATYGLTLADRDERWEVAELLPAPPIEER